jgi:hypothetical protein
VSISFYLFLSFSISFLSLTDNGAVVARLQIEEPSYPRSVVFSPVSLRFAVPSDELNNVEIWEFVPPGDRSLQTPEPKAAEIVRQWTDTTGGFGVMAKLVEADDEQVTSNGLWLSVS